MVAAESDKFNIITTTMDRAIGWARSNSLWPMPMGISCCAIEMMAIVGSRYDVSRFGSEVLRFSPRQSDLMIVAGTLTHKMAPVVRRIYDQMPEPKWVIAMGACLATGGMFDAYSVVQGLGKVLPIDAYVAGCPPRPENLLLALMEIQRKVRKKPSPIFGSINEEVHQATIPLEPVKTTEQPTRAGTRMLNMGPQHPSTHGVLRIVLELEDETIVRAYPHIGYLHRGYEKLGEHRTYHQYIPYTDRLDYLAPLSNNVAYVLAVEKLLDIDVTRRCQYVRVICCELARISSHLLNLGTYGMDIGAYSTFFYTFQQREYIYNLIEKLCGSRLTSSYTRIGGMMRDLPPNFVSELRAFLKKLPPVLDDLENLLAHNRIWVERTQGVGVFSKEILMDFAITGPILRASGVPLDLRQAAPYLNYNEFDFNVCTRENGDCYDRYMIRIDEIRESIKIITQALEGLPEGPINIDNAKVILPEKDNVYNEMESMIHHFMLFSEGIKPPQGEVYQGIESPKGELGFYLVSDGSKHPYRLRIRAPSFNNLGILQKGLEGIKIADAVAIIASLDPVMGECDR